MGVDSQNHGPETYGERHVDGAVILKSLSACQSRMNFPLNSETHTGHAPAAPRTHGSFERDCVEVWRHDAQPPRLPSIAKRSAGASSSNCRIVRGLSSCAELSAPSVSRKRALQSDAGNEGQQRLGPVQ